MMGGKRVVDFLAPAGSGENTLVHVRERRLLRPTSRSPAASRVRPSSRSGSMRPQEIETPGVDHDRGAGGAPRHRRRRRRRRRCRSSRPTDARAAPRPRRRPARARRSWRPLLDATFRPATDEEIRASFGAGGGLARAGRRRTVEVIADEALREGQFVAGANRDGRHCRGVEAGRDFEPRFADIRAAAGGRRLPECGGALSLPAGDRGRPHLQARDLLLGATRREVPRRGREGEADGHGQLRNRARPG